MTTASKTANTPRISKVDSDQPKVIEFLHSVDYDEHGWSRSVSYREIGEFLAQTERNTTKGMMRRRATRAIIGLTTAGTLELQAVMVAPTRAGRADYPAGNKYRFLDGSSPKPRKGKGVTGPAETAPAEQKERKPRGKKAEVVEAQPVAVLTGGQVLVPAKDNLKFERGKTTEQRIAERGVVERQKRGITKAESAGSRTRKPRRTAADEAAALDRALD